MGTSALPGTELTVRPEVRQSLSHTTSMMNRRSRGWRPSFAHGLTPSEIAMRPSPALLLPAKFSAVSEGEGGYHPLFCHMVDVGCVAQQMFDDVCSLEERRQIADGLGLTLVAARSWIGFLAGLHDLGKAAPAFLSHTAGAAVRTLLQDYFSVPLQVMPRDAPHGAVTTLQLCALLPSEFNVSPEIASALAVVVGGHHGIFPSEFSLGIVEESPAAVGGRRWNEARRVLLLLLASALAVPTADVPTRLSNAAAMTLAGLVTVADWIGSASEYFPYFITRASEPPPEAAFIEYITVSRDRAQGAMQALEWRLPRPPATSTSYAELFGDGFVPRPVQERALGVAAELEPPALLVIEVPTGEGKTEAALAVADRFLKAFGARGFYLALPTRATSDQMYTRAARFLRHAYHDDRVLLQLLHGHASLAAELTRAARSGPEDLHPGGIALDDGAESSVAAGAWFSYRKRGLLAPFGVGTVDQALLAALQTRHVFVRLFGLTRKTVVIDEVHAYDTYMSALLERLLEWLGALRAPVILLSATLPRAKSRLLLEAYARGLGVAAPAHLQLQPYPRVAWLSANQSGCVHVDSSAVARRSVFLRWVEPAAAADDSVLAALLLERLANGGCAAVICNSVRRAQSVYRNLQQAFSALNEAGAPVLELFHARYPFNARQVRESRTLDHFGDDNAHRPHRAVLVATQIIEQSLDLDFDLMFTDLAPIDLLLQRAGRLQRHPRARPARLERPELHVLAPESSNDVPSFAGADRAIYDRHILLRTWLALQRRQAPLRVPEDVEGLIEAVYSEDASCPDEASPALHAFWDETLRESESDREHERQEARDRWLKPPGYAGELAAFTADPRDEDAPEFHQAHQALTRLADPSVDVVCLVGTVDAPRFPGGDDVEIAHPPALAQARRLLRRSVPVSTRGLVQAILARPAPSGWRKSSLLRYHRLLVFDRSGECRIDRWTLRLDPETGLEIHRTDGG